MFFPIEAIVECKDQFITARERRQILDQRQKLPMYRWVVVSSEGFAPGIRPSLKGAEVSCVTYSELLRQLVPLDDYVNNLISEFESWREDNWRGEDWFIEPYLYTDADKKPQQAMNYIKNWLNDSESNLLVILGDLGTGKTILTRSLAYKLAQNFCEDSNHPAPVVIPLNETRNVISLEGIVIKHFSNYGLSNISFPRFEQMVHRGKIIPLFDASQRGMDYLRYIDEELVKREPDAIREVLERYVD